MRKKDAAKAARTPSNETDCNRTTSQTTSPNSNRKFELGQVVATRGAIECINRADVIAALKRHASGDWGEVCRADKKQNEFSLKHGLRLFSVYIAAEDGRKFWIITEADRSITTILLPEEY